ncbi:MAG: lipopolysaccharide biosynthesis protein [Planctomycetes bacterium]|nr:lipopolysaccharide biosynthesis protein [Planctomycetota bacterium]
MTRPGRKKYLLDYVVIVIAEFGLAVRPLVFIPLIIRILGKDAYGVWGQVVATSLLLEPFLTLKLSPLLTRFLAGTQDDRQLSGIFSASLLVPLAGGLLVLLAGQFWTEGLSKFVFGSEVFQAYVQPMFLYCISSAAVAVATSYFLVMNRPSVRAVISTCTVFAEIGLAAILLLKGYGLVQVLMWATLIRLGVVIGTAAYVVKRHGVAPPQLPRMPGLWSFGFWLILGQVLAFWASRGAQYFLVSLADLGAVAVFVIIVTLGNVIRIIGMANQTALLAAISSHWNAGQPELARPILRLAYKIIVMTSFPILVGLYFYGNAIIHVLAKRDMEVAPWLIAFYGLAPMALNLYSVSQFSMWMQKRLHVCIILQAIGALMNMGLALLLIGPFQIVGAVAAGVASMTLMAAIMYVISKSVFHTSLDWGHVLRCAGATAVMAVVLAAFRLLALPEWLDLLTGTALGAVVFGLAALALGAIRVSELKLAIDKVKSRFKPQVSVSASDQNDGA